MYQLRFFKFVTVAICLWVSQGNVAQAEQTGIKTPNGNANTCRIDSLTAGELSPISDPPTGLTGMLTVAISCKGSVVGNLQLNLNPAVVYNGGVKMQFVNGSGVLASANTNSATNTINIPVNSQGATTGNARVRVDIVAASDELLQPANNYSLVITAAFN
jgi:hypothetical protein